MKNSEVPTKVFKNLPEEKQRRIIEEAVREFAFYGFNGASINRLVKNLGIAKGSIFQYFGSKEGLFKAVFEHCMNSVKDIFRSIKYQSNNSSFFDKIKETILTSIKFARTYPEIYQLYLKMIFQEDFPLRKEYLKQIHMFSSSYLKDLVTEGINKGELRSNLDKHSTVLFLDALLDRFVQSHVVEFWDAGTGIYSASDDKLLQYIDELIQFLKIGLGAGE